MINLKIKNGILQANGYKICNLRTPFVRSIDIKKSGWKSRVSSYIGRTPSEVLALGGQYKYRFRTSKGHYHALSPYSKGNLRTNYIYKSPQHCAGIFVANALTKLFKTLSSDKPQFEEIKSILTVVINKVVSSYNFDLIISDLPNPTDLISPNFCTNKTILPANFNLTEEVPKQEFKYINSIVRYHKKIPLRILDSAEFLTLHPKYTDIDFSSIQKNTRVLVISMMNPLYAGYIAHVMSKFYKIKDVLPVSIFKIDYDVTSGTGK